MIDRMKNLKEHLSAQIKKAKQLDSKWCGIDEMLKDLSTEDIKDRRPEWCPLKEVKKPEKPGDEFETAYFAGFDYGGQMMLKEIIKMLKGMKWYGGDKQAQRTDRMPGDHAGRAADLQQELERAGTERRHGGRVGAGAAEN